MSARRFGALIGVVLSIGLVTGCVGSSTYDTETAGRLQQQVLAVSTASAEGDWAAASTALMELEASAATALARGEITQARFDAIMAAVSLVRADIDAAIAAAAAEEAAREAAEEESDDDDKGKPGEPGKPEKDD